MAHNRKLTLTTKMALSRIARYMRINEDAVMSLNDMTVTEIIDAIELAWDHRKHYNGWNSWEAWELYNWWSSSETVHEGWIVLGRQIFKSHLDLSDNDIKRAAMHTARDLGELMAQKVSADTPTDIRVGQTPTTRFWQSASQATIKEIDWQIFAKKFIVDELAQEEQNTRPPF
jgi:hypothetical protein